MKKPSGSLEVGLWFVGGLVGLYFLGAMAIYTDFRVNRFRVYVALPSPVKKVLGFLYTPLFTPIAAAWPQLFPPP